DVLRINGFGRFEDALQELSSRVLLADLGQIGAERAARAGDTVTVNALEGGRLEKQLSASPRVSLQGQNLLRLDGAAQPPHPLFVGDEALEQVAHLRVQVGCRRGQHLRPYRG